MSKYISLDNLANTYIFLTLIISNYQTNVVYYRKDSQFNIIVQKRA